MDINALKEKERLLTTAFHISLGEDNPYEEILTKFFKKKVKRVREKKQGDNDGE